MECRSCGNTEKFQAVITDFKPMEIWELKEEELTRFAQPDSGDVDIKINCLKCNSADIDTQGYPLDAFHAKKLVMLSEDAWDEKLKG